MADASDLTILMPPCLIIATHWTTELLCCGVAKIVSVAGPPGDEGGRALTASVSVMTSELFRNQS